MDCPLGEEAEMPIPINSAYGHVAHGHMIQHHHHNHHHHQHQHHEPPPQPLNHIMPSSAPPPSNGTTTGIAEQMQIHKKHHQHPEEEEEVVVRYRECMKNHAATMGGNATDGCGEFMPSGEEGTIEALTCSACHCHRNFHRKEVEGELPSPSTCDCHQLINRGALGGTKLLTYPNQHHHHYHHSSGNKGMLAPESLGYSAGGALVPAARSVPIMPLSSMALLPSSSEEQEGGGGGSNMGRASPHYQMVKKRFRTKFTKEQKEKMFNFAERVGWKMQKLEESVVQQFCEEVGIKRRVLKVWMHNNKHNLAKKPNSPSA